MDIDKEFKGIADALVTEEYDAALSRFVQGTRNWIKAQRTLGKNPTVRDLRRKLAAEVAGSESRRERQLTMLAAALWKLASEENDG